LKKNYQNDEFLKKRKERQKKLRKRRLKIFFTFFVIIALITGVILSLTILFPIKRINAKGSKIYTSSQIVDNCGVNVGDNLFTASSEEVLKFLKKSLPYVETVKFERTLPDTLNIMVTDAKEYACYNVGKKYFTVSKEGWTLNSYDKKPKNVIVIISDKVKCKVGSKAEFKEGFSHLEVGEIIDLLTRYKFNVNHIDITDTASLKVKIENRFIVDFGKTVDLEYKIKHLNSMLKEIDKKATGKIDLSMWNSQNTQGTFVQTDIK